MSRGDATPAGGTAAELIEAGEDALARGEPAQAYDLLARAASAPTDGALLHRLAAAYAAAARHLSRHDEVLGWIDGRIAGVAGADGADGAARIELLVARLGVWRLLDSSRVLELCDETIDAAHAAGDHEAVARALSHAAFACYRKGDARRAREFAERARDLATPTRAAQFAAIRTRLFAATTAGELEAALELGIKARALARELGNQASIANESNNLAETYLELGCPVEARACAEAAAELAGRAGHGAVHGMATVYAAIARAECGEIDEALVMLDGLQLGEAHRFTRIDAACVHAWWLLERGAAGDTRRARQVAEAALDVARTAGADNRLTQLHASIARALARDGQEADARRELERGRKAADRGDSTSHSMLALAGAEVLPASEPARAVVLSTARARILRRAARREDSHAFCVHVRLHRRLLELSGGVPPDLPRGS